MNERETEREIRCERGRTETDRQGREERDEVRKGK